MTRRSKTIWFLLLTAGVLFGLGFFFTRPRIDPRLVGKWIEVKNPFFIAGREVWPYVLKKYVFQSNGRGKVFGDEWEEEIRWNFQKDLLGDKVVIQYFHSGLQLTDLPAVPLTVWFKLLIDDVLHTVVRRYRISFGPSPNQVTLIEDFEDEVKNPNTQSLTRIEGE
jgi:hypothetical protein